MKKREHAHREDSLLHIEQKPAIVTQKHVHFLTFWYVLCIFAGQDDVWVWGKEGINKRLSATGVVALMPCPRPDGVKSRCASYTYT
jgi:hypothetical protein